MTTLDDTQGWKARVTESPADFARDTKRLMVGDFQRDDSYAVLTGFGEDGHAVLTTHARGTANNDFPGFALPNGALAAIRNAIEPGPSVAELRRLEQALDVERSRVDAVLGQRPAADPVPVQPAGVWLAYYSDWSAAQIFATEIEARRYAADLSMTVTFWQHGTDLPR